MENKKPIISDLATNTTLTAAEIKIPNIRSLVQIRKDQIIKQYYWDSEETYWSQSW